MFNGTSKVNPLHYKEVEKVERDLDQRVMECGVTFDTLQLGVNSGAYPTIEAALDHMDRVAPIGKLQNKQFSINRMIMMHREIDKALFKLARATCAWTWLNDYKMVFVLIGHQLRGMVVHEELKYPVPFRLILHRQQDGIRFLRFFGDVEEERVAEGKKVDTPVKRLARELCLPIHEVRDILEALVRTCDDGGWTHTMFPFIHMARVLDTPHRLMKQQRLLLHSPFIRVVP